MSQRFRVLASLLVLAALMLPIRASHAQSRAADTLSGTIHINLAATDQDVWQAVANAYMKLHPNVKVLVNLKPTDSHYADYISSGFAAGTPSFDLVQNNQNLALINAGKFLDFAPYLNQPDPYIGGKPWRDAIDLKAMAASAAGNKVYDLNLETVQIFWFYNKEAFQKAGIARAPTTWPQLLADCAKLKQAGYIPVSLGGDYNTLWAANTGWLFRMYADQYTRSLINDERSHPGDYTYDATIDPKFHYDASDPYNDDSDKVTVNPLRRLIAIKKSFSDTPAQAAMDRWRLDSKPLQAVDQNLHDLMANDTPSGWFGSDATSAYALFLQQKSAIMLDTGARLTSFEKDLKGITLANKKKTGAFKPFTLGLFNNPSMVGPYVQAPARTIAVAIDFYGVPKKSFAQNKLNVDFLEYFTSPQGYGQYVKASIASPNGSLNGPPIIRNVQLPAFLQARFNAVKQIGNTEKAGTAGVGSRGFDDYQPSVRSWVDLMQQYLSNKMTTAQYARAEQQNVQSNFENVLKFDKLADSDLQTPQKQPPVRQ